MALAFYDNFNRDNGPIGEMWSVQTGSAGIQDNTARPVQGTRLRSTIQPTGANASVTVVCVTPTTFNKTIALRLRTSQDGNTALYARWLLGTTQITLDLGHIEGGNASSHVSIVLPWTYGETLTLQFSAFNDHLAAWTDGYDCLHCKLDDVMTSGYCEISASIGSHIIDDYYQYDLSDSAASALVSEEPDENGDYTITLYNSGAAWTPGTPGSPVFSMSQGTIVSQTIDDADTATLVWTPPTLFTTGVLSDPLNSHSYLIELATSLVGSPGGGEGGGLTTQQAETMSDLALYLSDYQDGGGSVSGVWLKLGTLSLLAGSAYSQGDGSALGDLLDAALNSQTGLAVIKNRIDLIRDTLDDLTNTEQYTLPGVQEAIRGTSSRDLTQVYNLIAGLSPADQTDVTDILNAIAAIRTGNLWTLDSVKTWIEAIPEASNQDVLNELALIRTANFWTLGHVMDAIAAISIPDYSTDLQDLADAVDAIPTNPITDLSSVLTAISGVRGSGNPDLATLLTAINARPTNPITSLQSVLDAINTLSGHVDSQIELVLDAIAALTPNAATPTAPVWPGIGNVTLGDPINLGLTFAYSGACDGVLVNITADPLARGLYDWGTETQHPRAGYVSFVSDNGDYTDPSPFTFANHLLTPTHMLHADGFIGRARSGVAGTVTPWTITVA